MKLSELNDLIAARRDSRDALHDELHALLADENISQGIAKTKETEIRSSIRAAQEELYPLEMERAEIERTIKGQPRKRVESWVDFEITLG